MVKKITSLNIDSDIVEQAKRNFLNMSEIAERALKDKLNFKPVDIQQQEKPHCEFCGKEDRKATKDDLLGLTWLWPDEKWICEGCLKIHRDNVAVAVATKR